MNTWQALKKIIRDQFSREAPEPWDGRHLLRDWYYVEHVAWPDDYNTGWVWECTCGISNKKVIPPQWPHSENGTIQEFIKHAQLHEELKAL